MNILKAFAHIGPLINNEEGEIAPVGELAPLSMTFVRRQPTVHSHSDFSNLSLVGFTYAVDDVVQNVTDAIAYQCLRAVSWTYNRSRLGDFDETKDSFQQAFIQQWGEVFDLIDSGAMVPFENYFCPERIEIAPKNQSATTLWRIWFANDSFYNQFDESTILPVAPVENIDLFFGDTNQVRDLIASIKMADLVRRSSLLRGPYPETVLRDDVFDWVDPIDRDIRIPVDWMSLIYGIAGDNLDSAKEAIRDWILDNSEKTRDEWAVIFPDLFMSTEIIIIPAYHKIAIPNATRELGVFSPVIGSKEAMELAHKVVKGVGYTDAHIDEVLETLPSFYRSVGLIAVGGPENRGGIDRFSERFPDLINVPSTHVDFQRMSESTKKFVLLLNQMLPGAEDLTPNSGVPTGMNRLTRDGIVYLATSFEGFLYLVVSKYSVDANV